MGTGKLLVALALLVSLAGPARATAPEGAITDLSTYTCYTFDKTNAVSDPTYGMSYQLGDPALGQGHAFVLCGDKNGSNWDGVALNATGQAAMLLGNQFLTSPLCGPLECRTLGAAAPTQFIQPLACGAPFEQCWFPAESVPFGQRAWASTLATYSCQSDDEAHTAAVFPSLTPGLHMVTCASAAYPDVRARGAVLNGMGKVAYYLKQANLGSFCPTSLYFANTDGSWGDFLGNILPSSCP